MLSGILEKLFGKLPTQAELDAEIAHLSKKYLP